MASGDPLSDRVILWTRVTPKSTTGSDGVVDDRARSEVGAGRGKGEFQTGAARDYTVKVDATGLQPATAYYYRFESLGERSAIGRTRTLAGGRRVAPPPRRRVVLEPAAGLLQRLRVPRQSRRSRRHPASGRLPLRIRERAVRRRHQVRPHPGAEQGNGGAAGLPRTARAVQGGS